MQHHFLQHLRARVAQGADRTALLYRGQPCSYAELDAQARCWAARLQALGLEPGDRVALSTPDKVPFLLAHLGTLYAGGVSLPLNPRFTREELRYFLADSGARVAVVGADNRPLVEELRPDLPALQAVVEATAVGEASSGTFREPSPRAEDAALMVYSSGTTGWPKGVVHTHASTASGLGALQSC